MVLGWEQATEAPPRRWGFALGSCPLLSGPPSDFLTFNPHVLNACDMENSGLRVGLWLLLPDVF